MTTKPTPQQVLDLELPANDSGAGYLIELLRVLWREEEGFSGKRPFGNSGWVYEVYGPLVKAGWVEGEIDDEGYVAACDTRAADALMDEAIHALGQEQTR
jgi:hypothetical protein